MLRYTREQIIESIRTRDDRKVLDWIYKNVYPKVKKYIVSNNGSLADSKDIFQEAVLVFYNLVINGNSDNISDFEGFIIMVARNKWINIAKKTNKQIAFDKVDYEIDNQSNSPLVDIIMREKWAAFQDLFNQIGDRCKKILTYTTYEKLSMEEVAKKMGMVSADAAKAANYRCKQKMIEIVAKNKGLANSLSS